jgi:protein SCO1/2
MFRPLLPLLLLFCLTGCNRDSTGSGAAAPTPERVSTYEVRGVLRKLIPGAGKAVIAHEAITGYMEAMTMEFTAGDAGELAGVQPGDALAFRLNVTDERSWIDRVRKIDATPQMPAPLTPAADALPPGTPLPDCALTDSRGTPLRLRDFQGRALAFTFIFTRCPLPDFCPRMNAHFAVAQRALAAAAPDAKWHLLCISLDPEYDTPARLADYATRYQPDAARWTFATGAPAEIETLARACSLQVARGGALPEHNLRTVVVNAAGRVQRAFAGNEWTPEELVAEMRRAMATER